MQRVVGSDDLGELNKNWGLKRAASDARRTDSMRGPTNSLGVHTQLITGVHKHSRFDVAALTAQTGKQSLLLCAHRSSGRCSNRRSLLPCDRRRS